MNDRDLVRAIQGGDGDALTILYERYVRAVWRYIDSNVPRTHTEDLVSEVFLAALRTIQTFDPQRGEVHSWLIGIARNKLRDHWRTANRSPASSPVETTTLVDANSCGPDGELMASERSTAVTQALASLKDDERLALEWKYLESLSVREMAERWGRSERAIEGILYRARRSFRAAYACGQTRITET